MIMKLDIMSSLLYHTLVNRKYYIQLFSWLAVYAVLLEASILILRHGVEGPLVVPVALLPMLPAFGIVAANMTRYRAIDELEKRMLSESIVFSFGCTAIVTFSYGFLESAAHAPMLSYFWVWPVMAAFWLVGSFLVRRRYR